MLRVEVDAVDSKPGGIEEVIDNGVQFMVLAPDLYPPSLALARVKAVLR